LRITFFHQLISDTAQLTRLIGHTPKFKTHIEAHVVIHEKDISVTLPQTFHGALQLGILFEEPDQHLSYLRQVCSSSLPQDLFPAVERFYFFYKKMWGIEDATQNGEWLELLHPFIAVKYLYLSEVGMRCIAPVLQELVGEKVTELLPALQTLSIEKPLVFASKVVKEAIEQFNAAKRRDRTSERKGVRNARGGRAAKNKR
jgi:hypothetical protein